MGGGQRGSRTSYAVGSGAGGGGGSRNSKLSDFEEEEETNNDAKDVFISHSRTNAAQVGLLRHQAKNENYDLNFNDTSLKNPVKYGGWRGPVGTKIRNSDAVIVLVGEDTASRTAVSWEVQYAYDHNIPVIPVKVHSDKRDKLPKSIQREGDRPVKWQMNTIQREIDTKKAS